MIFTVDPSDFARSNRQVIYRISEHSFDVEPASLEGFTSLLINDLNLELDKKGQIISVWGLCPRKHWLPANLSPPQARPATICIGDIASIKPNVSIRLNAEPWPVYVDTVSGWVRIAAKDRIGVYFAELFLGAILGFDDKWHLVELWLKPTEEP